MKMFTSRWQKNNIVLCKGVGLLELDGLRSHPQQISRNERNGCHGLQSTNPLNAITFAAR